jgi:molybdate transport system substrate-binding protein
MCAQKIAKSTAQTQRLRAGFPAALRRGGLLWLLWALILCGLSCRESGVPVATAPRPLRVAAAADLEPAFRALGSRFSALHGREVVFSFAGSQGLAQQIRHGAPFDLYAAASVAHIEALLSEGRIVPGSLSRYARGRLVLWAGTPSENGRPRPGAVPLPQTLADLVQPQYRRIALANPEHAPYGAAAVQALRAAGIYEALAGRLVFGDNVRQAQQYVATGNAEVVLGAQALAIASGGDYLPVPPALYPPLLQALGIVRGGDESTAAQLSALITSTEGQAILARFGFTPP